MESLTIPAKKILRYPRLDTIIMVEKAIQKYDGEFTKHQLWRKLPKQMMYQTFCLVLDYLMQSYKIFIDADGIVGTVQNSPELVKKYLARPDLDAP